MHITRTQRTYEGALAIHHMKSRTHTSMVSPMESLGVVPLAEEASDSMVVYGSSPPAIILANPFLFVSN